ncbi:hypothetical protein MBAV_005949, partial [Candidatus Magnetobacterium bavaricum]
MDTDKEADQVAEMKWFRMWDEAYTDPKMGLIASKAKTSLANVLAVWQGLLTQASLNRDSNIHPTGEKRGSIAGFDPEVCDAHLRIESGVSQRIIDEIEAKGMIKDGYIANWGNRQPLREDSSAERVREHRARKQEDVTQCNAPVTQCNAPVTQCNARPDNVTQCNHRGDKIRLDNTEKKKSKPKEKAQPSCVSEQALRLADVLFSEILRNNAKSRLHGHSPLQREKAVTR